MTRHYCMLRVSAFHCLGKLEHFIERTDLAVSSVWQRLEYIKPVCDGSTQIPVNVRCRTRYRQTDKQIHGQCPILRLAQFTEPLPDN